VVLVERDVAIDMVAGTSVGAIVGACYAKMMTDNSTFRSFLSKIGWDDLFGMESLNINSVMGGFFRVYAFVSDAIKAAFESIEKTAIAA